MSYRKTSALPEPEAVQLLRRLAAQHLAKITGEIDTFEPIECTALLIEATRVMDQHHIYRYNRAGEETEADHLRFDLARRGWNPLLSRLLARMPLLDGVPLAPSTPDTRATALEALHAFGAYAAMTKGLAMYEIGMLDIRLDDGVLRLRMKDDAPGDHFLDALEVDRLRKAVKALDAPRPGETLTPDQVDALIEPLVFPWKTTSGTMIGYTAMAELDRYYLEVTRARAGEIWGSAGIHPDAKLPGCSGGDLLFIITLKISFYLKHWRFVDVGKRKYPEANFSMSATVWKSRQEMIDNMSEAYGIPPARVTAAFDLITVTRAHAEFFWNEDAPYIPLLIEVGNGYLLQPLSSVFRDPLEGAGRLMEATSPQAVDGLRRYREDWMIADLSGLFQGDRFWRLQRPVKLRRNGQVVTDIDAAIYDYRSGDLALFQLKWQDFGSDPRSQRSKAGNFVRLVDTWASKTDLWISQFGVQSLCEKLQLRIPKNSPPPTIRLFAIGRSNARFRSYGFAPSHPGLAAGTWHQMARMVLEAPDPDAPLSLLHAAMLADEAAVVEVRPMPYEISIEGRRIAFEDVWRIIDVGSKRHARRWRRPPGRPPEARSSWTPTRPPGVAKVARAHASRRLEGWPQHASSGTRSLSLCRVHAGRRTRCATRCCDIRGLPSTRYSADAAFRTSRRGQNFAIAADAEA